MNFVKIPTRDFEMQDAPITQAEWDEVMGGNPSHFRGPNLPVDSVSWKTVQKFISLMNAKDHSFTYRLPKEEEWKFVAKHCDEQRVDEIAWHWANSDRSTHPVREKTPNKLGIYDLLGNVWEWCEDKWNEDNRFQVARGGSWYNAKMELHSYMRSSWYPEDFFHNIGFRLVRNKRVLPVSEPIKDVAVKQVTIVKGIETKVRSKFDAKSELDALLELNKELIKQIEELRKK